MNDIDDQGPAGALVALSHHILKLFAEVGRAHRLSQQQVELICAVVTRDRVGMTELGRLLALEKSNVSNLVDRLEQRGLAERTRDPDDRRATQVVLTDAGTELAIRTHDEVTERMDSLVNTLRATDQRRLTALVGTLMDGVS